MISQLLDFLFGQPSEFIPVVYTTPFADKFQYFFVSFFWQSIAIMTCKKCKRFRDVFFFIGQ